MKAIKHTPILMLLILSILFSTKVNAQCTAGFTSSVTGATANFTGTSSHNFNYPVMEEYIYSFGDGTSTGITMNPNQIHSYSAMGTYQVKKVLTIRDSLTLTIVCSDSITSPVTIGTPAAGSCNAGFTTTTSSTTVNFTSTSSNTYTVSTNETFYYNFGDGSNSTQQNPSHTYANPGNYSVTKTYTVLDPISNLIHCVDTAMAVVSVGVSTNCNNTHNFQITQNQNVVTFTASALTPPPAGVTVLYSWNFGDGFTSSQNTSPMFTHTYNNAGSYNACLMVQLSSPTYFCIDTFCAPVTITTVPGISCNASFTTSTSGSTVNFTGSSSHAYTIPVVTNCLYNFGDGNSSPLSSSPNASHNYSAIGTYQAYKYFEVRDSLTNALLCSDTTYNTVVFNGAPVNVPCEALFTFSTDSFLTNQCYFNSTMSHAGMGTNPTIIAYSWDFGDGNTSTLANPAHTYATPGIYNVCLTITSSNNCTDNLCLLVEILPNNAPNSPTMLLYGFISPAPSAAASVYLIRYNAQTQSLSLVKSLSTSNGLYYTSGLTPGTYLIKAAYATYDFNYANYLPTYYTANALWSGGTNVTSSGGYNINMLSGTPTSGPGFIGGSIITGANKTLGVGDPKHKLSVLLMDKITNQFIAFSRTDINGEYTFDNLPMGDYQVFVEELGKTMTPADVTITASNSSFTKVHFESNSTENHPLYSLSVEDEFEKNSLRYSLLQNPVQNSFAVQGLNGSQTVQLFDMNGKILKEFNSVRDGQSLDIQDISNGVYLINISGKYPTKPIKLVITH